MKRYILLLVLSLCAIVFAEVHYTGINYLKVEDGGTIGDSTSQQMVLPLYSIWDANDVVRVIDMTRGSSAFPNGIVITSWYLDCEKADPVTEITGDLKYCDSAGTGAFPGANPVLVDVLDTTTGNSSETDMSNSDLGSGTIPTGKVLYFALDADPTDEILWYLVINYYKP